MATKVKVGGGGESSQPTTPAKSEPDKAFALRMAQACDGNPLVPAPNYGRLQWFIDNLKLRFNLTVSHETVRRWLNGESIPRRKYMPFVAELLGVDEVWLTFGRSPELDNRQQKLRNAEADGVVNVVAGFIQMCGANPAFPEAGDKRAEKEHIDIYAIIRGAQYAFHVALAAPIEGGHRFGVPIVAADAFIIGVVRTSDLTCDFYEIDAAALEGATRKAGLIEVTVGAKPGLKQIKTFAERL